MDINLEIDKLIIGDQYNLNAKEKEKILLPILLEQIKKNKKTNLKIFYNRLTQSDNVKKLIDIPPLPVSLFKEYELRLVPKEEVVRILTSSGTMIVRLSCVPSANRPYVCSQLPAASFPCINMQ